MLMGHFAKFIWDKKYSVGVLSIDEQHKNFFKIANTLIDLLMSGTVTRDAVLAAAKDLQDYANYHLATEEGYFKKFDYPAAPHHIDEHMLYRKKIEHFMAMIADSTAVPAKIAEEMANYSISWLTNHILMVDKAYTEFFQEHGVR